MELNSLYKLFLKGISVTTDTRKIKQGSLFFALKGDNFDGNKYAEVALQKGCSYAIIDDETVKKNDRYILVENVLVTLQKLANYHRQTLKIPIVAITGTNGKTTTKELIAAILSKKFEIAFTEGNLNNHIGVPLTLLSMTEKTEIGVVEMGANHPHEIMNLCEIAEPNYGVITNIGKAHIEGFGSFENVIKTKSELYDYLESAEGTVFYNKGNEILSEIINKNKIENIAYGDSSTDIFAETITTGQFLTMQLSISRLKYTLNTNLVGKYNVENILAAVSIGKYFEILDEKIIFAIEEYKPTNNRSQFVKTDKNNLILDAYNANPTSVFAALENFVQMNLENKCVVLGDMLELGEISLTEHLKVITYLEVQSLKQILLVGEIYSSFDVPKNMIQFKNVDELILWLESNKIDSSNVLIKGSRGIRLERIVENL
ncbi:MAG: UDP-N-acetylmuramoyl-tripeptide--D-alanyl-D-alanine ligase [Bacteroidales bacterium]|nr:UDP-N-acetylmuramoyl-tripeptide--D-alanyl-D-alanine ligase [Bacteroidales bacterium]